MKQIFFFMMLYMIACIPEDRDSIVGPAYNYEDRGIVQSCDDRSVYQNGEWLDDKDGNDGEDSEEVPNGVSDCIDLQLWSPAKNQYYDRCCYIRFQKDGVMHAGCIGLAQEQLIDITETIKKMEDGDKRIWTRDGAYSKIYQLDCSSSYIKYVAFAFIGFICLFF